MNDTQDKPACKTVIGRFFTSEKALFRHLGRLEDDFERVGYIQREDFLDKYVVIMCKGGMLLIQKSQIE